MLLRNIIIFALLFTIAHNTTINYFEAQINLTGIPGQPDSVTIFDTYIELWVDVTNCPANPCVCYVETNVNHADVYHAVSFNFSKPEIGNVKIQGLQPDTEYSFTLRCTGVNETMQRLVRTDYGRPSPPNNFVGVFDLDRIRFSWLPPSIPAGPIHYYTLIMGNQNRTSFNISSGGLSFDLEKPHIPSETNMYFLRACNVRRYSPTICSEPNNASTTVTMSTVTKPNLDTTIKPNQSNILLSSWLHLVLAFYILCL